MTRLSVFNRQYPWTAHSDLNKHVRYRIGCNIRGILMDVYNYDLLNIGALVLKFSKVHCGWSHVVPRFGWITTDPYMNTNRCELVTELMEHSCSRHVGSNPAKVEDLCQLHQSYVCWNLLIKLFKWASIWLNGLLKLIMANRYADSG